MSKSMILLRTFAWAAVGFLVTSGAIVSLGVNFEAGNYTEGLTALALALIAAILSGVLAALQAMRFSTDTATGKALNQFVQMLIAGVATLAIADLTNAAAVAFVGAAGKLLVASAIGAVQAYLVNAQPPVATTVRR